MRDRKTNSRQPPDGREVVLRIDGLAAGGDGVGRISGKVCFVPLAAPEDLVRAAITKENSRFLRGAIREVIEPGPGRRPPPCPLFGRCGGCQLQHLTEDAQIAAKTETLRRALCADRIEVRPSPMPLRYRALARLHAGPGEPPERWSLGFHARSGRAVVEALACPVLEPVLERCLGPLRAALDGALDGRAEVRLVAGDGGAVAVVEGDAPFDKVLYERLAALVPETLAGAQVDVAGVLGTVAGSTAVSTTGVDDAPFTAPASVFSQANRAVNRSLADTVCGWIAARGFARALELFAGSGNLTVAIARYVERLATAEQNPAACRAAKDNLAARGLRNVEVHAGDSRAVYERVGAGTELVVLDPPRQGDLALARAVAGNGHRAVLYVSCDPATMARDLEPLRAAGFEIANAAGFDMFPQTAHLEAAVLLVR